MNSINCPCLFSKDINSPLQTVLLCSPCKDHVCDAEHRFWNSIHRLKNVLACGRLLPGAGVPEIACIRRLNELAGSYSLPRNTAETSDSFCCTTWFRGAVYEANDWRKNLFLFSQVNRSHTVHAVLYQDGWTGAWKFLGRWCTLHLLRDLKTI